MPKTYSLPGVWDSELSKTEFKNEKSSFLPSEMCHIGSLPLALFLKWEIADGCVCHRACKNVLLEVLFQAWGAFPSQ